MLTLSTAQYRTRAVCQSESSLSEGRCSADAPVPASALITRAVGRFAKWLEARAIRRHFEANVARLVETSPHLLDDIGLADRLDAPRRAMFKPSAEPVALPLEPASVPGAAAADTARAA